jgi:hypothetical protein
MKINRFEEGFEDAEDWGDRWASDETGADPEPELEREHEPDGECVPEDGIGSPPSRQALGEPLGGRQAADQGLAAPRRQKASSPFIKGPLCREWVLRALALPKSALRVSHALWFKAGVEKDDFIRGGRAESAAIRVDRGLKKRFEITPWQLSRGLHALKEAGLIVILKGGAGRCPVVAIVNVQIPRNSNRRNPK